MSRQTWDVVVVGGGITGAGIARDAAFRGLKVAVLEKNDWSSGTSSATSKLAHGGLRYLKTYEFSLVRESLRERRYLEIIAPHVVYPLPFIMPIYKQKFILTAGMILYDLLSYDKNRLGDPSKKLPHFKLLSRKRTIALEPGIHSDGLKGGALYYDCQNLYPDRVCLEFVRDAVHRGAMAANYAKVTHFTSHAGNVTGVAVEDVLNPAQSYTISGKLVINATGPWADLMFQNSPAKLPKSVRRSKGIHLVTRPLTNGHALVLETKTGRVFFVLPWRGYSIVGTTDVDYKGNPDDVHVTEKDRDDLIRELNEVYPSARLTADEVLYSYVGIRPLVEEVGKDTTEVSRKHELYDHEQWDRVKGLITVMGGKWTTTRELAEEVTDLAIKKLGREPVACTTRTPLDVGHIDNLQAYIDAQVEMWRGKADAALVRSLIEIYGTRYREVYERYVLDGAPLDQDVFAVGHDEYAMGQIRDAIDNEMTVRLDDLLCRRTGMGTLGLLSHERVVAICRYMATCYGWDEGRVADEIDRYYRSFAIVKD